MKWNRHFKIDKNHKNMTKILLNNTIEFNLLLLELKEDETTEVSFETEENQSNFRVLQYIIIQMI